MATIPCQVIADFYDASLDPTRWPHALLALGESLKAEAVGILVHDFEEGSGRFERAVGITADAQANYRRSYARSNPWFRSDVPFRAPGAVVRGSDLASSDVLKASSFHRNWLRPTGLHHHMFAVMDRQGNAMTFLALARREGKSDFGDDAKRELQAFLPTLARSLAAGAGIRQVRAVERAVLQVIDALPLGVAVLDRNGCVIEANPFARRLIEIGEGLTVVDGGLGTEVGSRRVRLRDLIGRSEERGNRAIGEDLALLPVQRPSSQRPLTLMLAPLEADPVPGNGRVPAALLFIGDPERPAQFDQTRIARLYGLSRAESRVAALLASGYRLEQVAEALDIAYETVRKHLKQIFGKTGTYRQAELVRMIVTGPAGLAI
jgi:DNA-binding CsgD family transcriptional regulator